ncbi:MAG TPA: PHP domain-containing protein [Dehalococcoidia bacterium]|nr:PHP domain-containing protein [Dehalococcoidia bacterium]
MRSVGDFHLHSTISDGRLTPTQVVDLAYKNGVRVMSLTDHDIVDGLPEAFAAADKYPDLTLIPGIEMSTDVPGNEVHILGHFIDWKNEEFRGKLAKLQESRLGRARRMVDRLVELGKPIEWERVQSFAEGAVGRPHVALALVEAGHVSSVNEAFDLYISRNGPAYVERERLEPEEVVAMIKGVDGIATLAHPRELNAAGSLEALLERLCAAGLSGMETYYQDYNQDEVEHFRTMCERFGLIPMGGSDYHGLGNPQQRDPGDIPLPVEPIKRFLALAEERGCIKHAQVKHSAL